MYNIVRYKWTGAKIDNQRKVAKAIGINECHLSRIVNRRITCPTRTAIAISEALGLNINDLFERV